MPYIPREPYRDAIDAFAVELDDPRLKPEFVERVRTIFAQHDLKFFRVILKKRSALGTDQLPLYTEPSDWFLRLRAAVLAHDDNALNAIAHDLDSYVCRNS